MEQAWFEDDYIAAAARDAVTLGGAVYCSATGNDGPPGNPVYNRHYQGIFTNGGGGFHNFKPGGSDDLLNIDIFEGETVEIWFQWDEEFGSAGTDYDIQLFELDGVSPIDTDFVVGYTGDNDQDGNDYPQEVLLWNNTNGARQIGVAIISHSSNETAHTCELFAFQAPFLDDDAVDADAVYGHPAVTEVVSCGAVHANDPGINDIVNFSSRGPSTLTFPAPVVRDTPFCSAIDRVEVSGVGGFGSPFSGTSAAAPHAAAIVALLLDAVDGQASPAAIRQVLRRSAVDIEAPGFDNLAGHGRLDALTALNYLMLDSDSDTMEDWKELIAGTDTNSAASRLAVASVEAAPGGVVLAWTSVSGIVYRVLCTTNLASGFQVVTSSIPGLPPLNWYTGQVGAATAFYRIGVQEE